MQLEKTNRPSVVQQVIDRIISGILNQELQPGERIPTEQELADGMGISRNTVREAIKMLSYIGVLEIRRPEGTFVCDGFSKNLLNPMIYGIILKRRNSYKDLMELREMIEAGVLRLAIEKATPDDLARLRKQLDRLHDALMSQPPDVERAYQEDSAFHDMIDHICENDIVSEINSMVRTLTYRHRYETTACMVRTHRGEEHFRAHERIYHILESGDASHLDEIIRGTYFLDVLEEWERQETGE